MQKLRMPRLLLIPGLLIPGLLMPGLLMLGLLPVLPLQALPVASPALLHQLKSVAEQSAPLPSQQFRQFLRQDPLGQPQLSPDGQWLAYWRREGAQYWLCRSRGDGEEQVLHKQRQPPEPLLSFSADGSRLWLVAPDQLRLLSLKSPVRLRTLWQTGAGLPGVPAASQNASLRLVQFSQSGSGFAIFAAQSPAAMLSADRPETGRPGTNKPKPGTPETATQWRYWSLGPDSTARTVWQGPLPLADLRLGSDGKPLAALAFQGAGQQLQLWQQSPAGLVVSSQCEVLAQCVIHQVAADGSLWLSRFAPESAQHQLWWYPPRTGNTFEAPEQPQLIYSTSAEFDAVLSSNVARQAPQHQLLAVRQRDGWHGVAAGWDALLTPLQADQSQLTLQLTDSPQTPHAGRVLLVSRQRSDQPLAQHLRLQLATQAAEQATAQIPAAPATKTAAKTAIKITATTTNPAVAVTSYSSQHLQLRGQREQADRQALAAPWLSFQTADNPSLPFRLWLPPGQPLAQAPLLLWLHGGPFGQPAAGFQPEIPLLLQQGVIVLQLAYRSSSGFGLPLLLAAGTPFAAETALTDIPALLDWLLKAGIGDPQQQAIAGHSFGGYLALQAWQRFPVRFRFVLAQAAPPDFSAALQQYLPDADRQQGHGLRPLSLELKARGLRLQADSLALNTNDLRLPASDQQLSPTPSITTPLMNQTSSTTPTPLYLWGGALDERVRPATLLQYQRQLQQQGQPVRLWLDPAAGHQPAAGLSAQSWLLLLAQLSQQHLKAAPAQQRSKQQDSKQQHSEQQDSAQQASTQRLLSRPDDSETDALEAYLQQIEVQPANN